jgi:hypothetical protein
MIMVHPDGQIHGDLQHNKCSYVLSTHYVRNKHTLGM